jgi:Zn-finger nucleic acid-binding protein
MRCPACNRSLTAVTISSVTVDVCQEGCAGVWFDQGELGSLDGATEDERRILLELTSRPTIRVDTSRRYRCPKCPDSVLMRHFFSATRAVTVDECPTCAGIWLDSGKLQRISAEGDSEDARKRAAQFRFEQIVVGERMELMRKELGGGLPYDTSRSRVAASLLVAFYLIVAFKLGGLGSALPWLSWCIIPWTCVSFPDAFAAAITPVLGSTRESRVGSFGSWDGSFCCCWRYFRRFLCLRDSCQVL